MKLRDEHYRQLHRWRTLPMACIVSGQPVADPCGLGKEVSHRAGHGRARQGRRHCVEQRRPFGGVQPASGQHARSAGIQAGGQAADQREGQLECLNVRMLVVSRYFDADGHLECGRLAWFQPPDQGRGV
jgi:hypothetical protein